MKDNLLEAGDEIYSIRGMSRESIYIEGKIDRVTKTQAVMGGTKFRRKIRGSSLAVDKIGSNNIWSSVFYGVVTDEIREQKKAQDKRDKFESVLNKWAGNNFRHNVRNLSLSKLERIAKILTEAE